MTNEVVIIGSGLAGTFAALELTCQGVRPTLLDIGHTPNVNGNSSAESLLLGDELEGLVAFREASAYLPPRLLAPKFQFVNRQSSELMPLQTNGSTIVQSTAFGGLANAWGAGVFRYTKTDLEGFPFSKADIEPFYDEVSKEIGISGKYDDLEIFLGREPVLQGAPALSPAFENAMKKYEKKSTRLNKQNFFLGRPRLAVLTEPHQGRQSLSFDRLEFLQPHLSAIYTPAFTLRRLIDEGKVNYIPNSLVSRWRTVEGRKELEYRDLISGESRKLVTSKIFLAAGTINSTKIAAESLGLVDHAFPLLDNPGAQIPLLSLSSLGRTKHEKSFGSFQLSAIAGPPNGLELIGNILDLSGPSRSSLLSLFPFPVRQSIKFIRDIIPAMSAMFVFGPANSTNAGQISFSGGAARIVPGQTGISSDQLKSLITGLRKLGLYSHPLLARTVPFGGAIHYAGTLPMRSEPRDQLECNSSGQLVADSQIYILDAASFPHLPAKNHSFTLMANAMRVARLAVN